MRASVVPPTVLPWATREASPRRLALAEVAAGGLAFAAWMTLLAAGIAVGTQDFIDPVRNHKIAGAVELIGCLAVIVACHTVTNTAMLCCVSAFLGALGFRAVGGEGPGDPAGRRDAYVAAVTRGFFIFLIVQSGSILLSDQAFTNLSLEKYIRLAGLSSLLSFTAGYNPDVFRQLMDRVNKNLAAGTVPK
ncbi:hypothetical protein [Paludisphaera soli]|uniref:hypothetical protein n=1 Tax=Paludisphaera soli TaxID=2712865 RepID=UPI0013EC587A|nr:hypothetical protein [Paludisphaera soli]